MTSPAEKMRDAAAQWCADEANNCDDAAKWGGHRKYVADCKAAAYALRNAYAKIRALPIPQEPPVDVNEPALHEHQTGLMLTGERKADVSAGLLGEVKTALRAAGDALADSQWSGGSAERRVSAALARLDREVG